MTETLKDMAYTLAFNGLQLPLPEGWDIISMDKRYLCIGPDMHPALELRWEPITGSFSMKKHMKRVRQSYGHGGKVSFYTPPTNKDGSNATIVFFQWEKEKARGEGGILFDSESNSALVFQCNAPFGMDNTLAKEIFDVLHLQHTAKRRWRIYDIQAELPDWLKLDSYKFAPGLFKLNFSGPSRLKIHLFRMGPASIILEKVSLADWASPYFSKLHPQHGIQLTANENGVVVLDLEGKTPLAERIVPWRRTYGLFLAKHEQTTNRILALAASARRPLDIQPLKDIFARYVTFPQKTASSDHQS